MNKFFENLPARLKLALHIVELALCMYAATGIGLLFTPYAEYVRPYLAMVAISFLLIYPIVHTLLELVFGEKKADETQSLTALVYDQIRAALTRVLNKSAGPDEKS